MKELHNKAMKLFQQAILVKNKDLKKYNDLLSKALEIEKNVISEIDSSANIITKSALKLSGASIAHNLGYFKDVHQFISSGISTDMPFQIFNEMLEMLLNKSQYEFTKGSEDYTRTLAPAGSGKTTTLLWKCLYDTLLTNGKNKYLIFTFTRVARDELRNRITTLNEFKPLNKKARVETLNQWGYSYIRSIKDGLQLKTSKQDNYYLLNNNLRPLWERKPFLSKLSGLTYRYNDIINIFGELKTLGFRHNIEKSDFLVQFRNHYKWLEDNNLSQYFIEKVYKPLIDYELVDFNKKDEIERLKPFLEFWSNASESLWEQSIVTLEDQKYWALLKLIEQYPDDRLFPVPQRYNYILVDEFQDINPLDLFLIKRLNELNKSKLTIVGDDDQAIFEWRASSPNFILYPENYFNKNFQTYLLDINYRSPKNIVDLSQKLIKNNKRRVDKNVIPFSTQTAKVEVKKYKNHIESIKFVNELAQEYYEMGEYEKLAIISRKKAQLIPIQISLTSNDIEYFAKEDLNILLSSAFNELKRILEVIPGKDIRKSSDEVINSVLLFCNKIFRYNLKKSEYVKLRSFLHTKSPKTFMRALDALKEYPEQIKSHSAVNLYLPIYKVINSKTVSEAIVNIGEELEGLKQHYAKSDDDIYYKDPPFTYLAEYAERYEANFWDFIDHVEAAISKMISFDDYNDNIDESIRNNVHLMTALRAKGKEFETVVILDVNDGIWPIKYATDDHQLEQERRLFYVAMTRAKKRLVFLTLDEMLGNPLKSCPYLEEMGLI